LRQRHQSFMSMSSRPDTQAIQCELASEVLRSQEILHLQAAGRSMLPTIWPGDTLVIDRLAGDEIALGDIVLFTRNGRFVAHRVVANRGEQIHTQGDAVSSADAPLSSSDLIGRVSMIVRNGKLVRLRGSQRATDRALSTVVRRSEFAARVVMGVHKIRLALRERVLHEAT
jgi:signal peptidase I